MKKLFMFAMWIVAVIAPSLCTAQQLFPDKIVNKKGVKLVKFGPWILEVGLKGKETILITYGINKLTAFELITSEDKTQFASLYADVDEIISDMKLENVLEISEDNEKINIYVKPIPEKKDKIDTFIIRVQKPEEITVLGIQGEFNLSRMIDSNTVDVNKGSFFLNGLVNVN